MGRADFALSTSVVKTLGDEAASKTVFIRRAAGASYSFPYKFKHLSLSLTERKHREQPADRCWMQGDLHAGQPAYLFHFVFMCEAVDQSI